MAGLEQSLKPVLQGLENLDTEESTPPKPKDGKTVQHEISPDDRYALSQLFDELTGLFNLRFTDPPLLADGTFLSNHHTSA